MVLAPAAIVETRGVALSGFGGAVHCGCGLRLGGSLPPAGRPWELEGPSLCPDGAGAAAWPPTAGPGRWCRTSHLARPAIFPAIRAGGSPSRQWPQPLGQRVPQRPPCGRCRRARPFC